MHTTQIFTKVRSDFASRGVRCSGDLYLPGSTDRPPVVVMAHGFAGERTTNEQMVFEHVCKLGQIRKQCQALRRGQRLTLHVEDQIYLYARCHQESKQLALIVLNRSHSSWTHSLTPNNLHLADGAVFTDQLSGGQITIVKGSISLSIEPQTSAIYVCG